VTVDFILQFDIITSKLVGLPRLAIGYL